MPSSSGFACFYYKSSWRIKYAHELLEKEEEKLKKKKKVMEIPGIEPGAPRMQS